MSTSTDPMVAAIVEEVLERLKPRLGRANARAAAGRQAATEYIPRLTRP